MRTRVVERAKKGGHAQGNVAWDPDTRQWFAQTTQGEFMYWFSQGGSIAKYLDDNYLTDEYLDWLPEP